MVTVCLQPQRFTPLLADAARFARHSAGNRSYADKTSVNGMRRYLYRPIDQHSQLQRRLRPMWGLHTDRTAQIWH